MWVLSKRDVCTEHPCYDRHCASSWYCQLLYLTSHFLLNPVYYMTYEACVHILTDEDAGSSPSACKVKVVQKHCLTIIQPMVSVSHSITMLFTFPDCFVSTGGVIETRSWRKSHYNAIGIKIIIRLPVRCYSLPDEMAQTFSLRNNMNNSLLCNHVQASLMFIA